MLTYIYIYIYISMLWRHHDYRKLSDRTAVTIPTDGNNGHRDRVVFTLLLGGCPSGRAGSRIGLYRRPSGRSGGHHNVMSRPHWRPTVHTGGHEQTVMIGSRRLYPWSLSLGLPKVDSIGRWIWFDNIIELTLEINTCSFLGICEGRRGGINTF